MSLNDLVWRIVGPTWATLIMLLLAFPITVPAVAALVWRAKRMNTQEKWIKSALGCASVVLALWLWAAVFRSDQSGPTRTTRTLGVVFLLGFQIAAIAHQWKRMRWRIAELAWILPVVWVGIVASVAGLWWVQGWASV
jgi:hypothetical protein